ncbi:MAG: mercury methylation ferredoxin HgcB [Deltaproteobacteria bacterium]
MMGRLEYLKNVVTLKFNREKCVGCGMCLQVCPHAVMVKDDGAVAIDNRDACMECGACAMNCPAQAITVQTGVGCATAVINAALGRRSSSCCSIDEQETVPCSGSDDSRAGTGTGCC